MELKSRLQDYLLQLLEEEGFENSSTTSSAPPQLTPREWFSSMTIESLQQEVCVKGVYLSPFKDQNMQEAYCPVDIHELMAALVENLSSLFYLLAQDDKEMMVMSRAWSGDDDNGSGNSDKMPKILATLLKQILPSSDQKVWKTSALCVCSAEIFF